MLQTAGRGYVMGNAPEEIRQMFEYGTADNDHDGIAEVLEQLFAGDM
jgi:hydroxymethylpyrimidine pyrophosphatase-like HAD family hydrolase